jgi:hypothetical protein
MVSGLSTHSRSSLASLASSVGTLRKAMVVPASSRSRLASMPKPTRSGTTSCIRHYSQRADLGQALSRTIETPISSAMLSRFLCNAVDEPSKLSRSSMNLMMAWATGEPSRVERFYTLTISFQSERNCSAPQPITS